MSVDAAAGGALMNKNYTEAYALIEDMAQNHYQWTNKRAITTSTPSKKEAASKVQLKSQNYKILHALLSSSLGEFQFSPWRAATCNSRDGEGLLARRAMKFIPRRGEDHSSGGER
ncbi:hypothetical protein MTR_0346s0040 [Medicago truncatula]|uniref:Uncharacterized protein n=1 Tax=Medicago truncatula TaxID=3880 RepID=A0A072TR71_MEDTR|nr:hypothetical protein MTR_0346s0040 [Medicago truncatula]